jgi:hypothetical protein
MSKKTLASVIASAALMAVVGTAASAGASVRDAGNQLAGTWVVTVNRPAPLPPLTSLQIFTSDGSVIEHANEAPASRTDSYGSWQRVDGRLYAATALMFRFNPQTGAQVGTMKINRNIRLSEDGQTFAHAGRATLYDLDGNVLTSFPVTASGVRLEIEQTPEQP